MFMKESIISKKTFFNIKILLIISVFIAITLQTIPVITNVFAADEEAEAPKEGEEAAQQEPMEIFFKLDPFIINLRGTGVKRYLKTSMAIELEGERLKKEMELRTPQLRDTIITVLTSKSFNDLNSNEGKISLKYELMAHINRILKTGAIRAIYFTDFIIQ